MEITEEDIVWMEECLGGIKDERRQSGHFLHKLIDVLVIGLTTIHAGWDGYNVVEDFGKAKEGFFRTFLELPHGIPDEKTFARVFSWIAPGALLGGLQTWLMGVNKASGRTINIDGKTIRGSARLGRNGVHIVSAWVNAQHVVLGQVRTEEKSNEITAIPELLDTLEVDGDTITIDAKGCQTAIAAKIREKGADYVLSVKENQPGLYREIKEYFELVEEDWGRNPPADVWRSSAEKKNHGRQESREVLTEEDIGWLDGKEKWKDLRTIILYRRRSEEKGKTTVDSHYYISSRALDGEEAAGIIRGHWAIENGLHWFLDVCFGEDSCRARTNHAAENLNVMRKAALHLLRKTSVPEKRFSTQRKMFRATFSDDFLYQALFGLVK